MAAFQPFHELRLRIVLIDPLDDHLPERSPEYCQSNDTNLYGIKDDKLKPITGMSTLS